MKNLFKAVVAQALLLGGLATMLWLDQRPITFESQESKTLEGKPVFNEIRYFSEAKKDIWMMRQSHQGLEPDKKKWDRLAIIVDKSKSPRTARFYQLEPGSLDWTPHPKERGFRVACFMCHTNGPRAVRPNIYSEKAKVSLWDKGRIFLWNLRIKTYLRIEEDSAHIVTSSELPKIREGKLIPFRFPGVFENEKLTVQTCLKCHNDSAWGRGYLTRQNFMTIRFMTEQGHMPPFVFSLDRKEKKALGRFLVGL